MLEPELSGPLKNIYGSNKADIGQRNGTFRTYKKAVLGPMENITIRKKTFQD